MRLEKSLSLSSLFRDRSFLFISFISCISAVLEAFSVYAIFPFLQFVTDPSAIETSAWAAFLKTTFAVSDVKSLQAISGGILLGLMILTNLSILWVTWVTLHFSYNREAQMSSTLYRDLMHMSYEEIKRLKLSEMTKKLISEVEYISRYYFISVLGVVSSAVSMIAILAMVMYVSPNASVISGVLVCALFAVAYTVSRRYFKKLGNRTIAAVETRMNILSESAANARDTRIYGLGDLYADRYEKASMDYVIPKIISEFLMRTPRYALEIFAFAFFMGVSLYLVATNPAGAKVLIPLLGAYAYAGYRILPTIQKMYQSLTQIKYVADPYKNITEHLRNISPEVLIPAAQRNLEPLTFSRSIRLEGVSFHYAGTQRPILEKINLEIGKNSSIAIIGQTGSGKSTLIDLISGLLTPKSGTIYVDSVPLSQDLLARWRQSIGYVSQHVSLFNESLLFNITFSHREEDIDMERFQEALTFAHLNELAERLPEGYHTRAGENGAFLSGGERQRISIARAFYRDPQLLIFDEPTSALDKKTASLIAEAIKELSHRKTIIMVTHALDIVELFDEVFVLENGQLKRSARTAQNRSSTAS